MKLNLTLVGVLALVLASSFLASANDALTLDDALANSNEPVQTEQKNSMTWPMLPGESLADVARLFYPNNKSMQQIFVTQTLKLSAEAAPNLKPTTRFEQPTLLLIPTLKSLSLKSLSKTLPSKQKNQNKQALKMSYSLKEAIENLPEKLIHEYEELFSKNEFLKEQLAKLNEKIVFLETKLNELKLILDKNLSLPAEASPPIQNTTQATAPATTQPAAKKVFKNLNQAENTKIHKEPQSTAVQVSAEPSWFENINTDLIKAALVIAAIILLGAFLLKKYRERMFEKLSFTATKLQNTVTDFSGYFEKTKIVNEEISPEAIQQQQAAKEVEARLISTLEEAKLLMSVNRTTDAIEHLKTIIKSQPKASINHRLYLLEVYRKLNLKDEFEEYADNMHETFNVMTPVWYEKEAAVNALMVVPQSLEEFPHIMQQLDGVWPGELATVYLRSLINDNRGGERIGFGKAVLSEILLLIAILDTQKEIPN